jgi:hypothetical protein
VPNPRPADPVPETLREDTQQLRIWNGRKAEDEWGSNCGQWLVGFFTVRATGSVFRSSV